MGQEESLPGRRPDLASAAYAPINSGGKARTQHHAASLPAGVVPANSPFGGRGAGTKNNETGLLKTSFRSIWSIRFPESLSPIARMGHFTAFSEEFQKLYIGYGENFERNMMNDMWQFDVETGFWSRVQVDASGIKPRVNSSASICGNSLVVFGGKTSDGYVAELHVVDLVTRRVMMLEGEGDAPPPMIGAVVEATENEIFVWGGYNDQTMSDLYVLDKLAMTWRKIPTEVAGRHSLPWQRIGDRIYAYGSSNNHSVIIIDTIEESVSELDCIGAPPPSETTSAGMCKIGNNLVYFGGRADSKWTLIYCLDVERLWWFVLHVVPDQETTSVIDGRVSELGLFMVPRIHHFSVAYSQQKRVIIATLGHPLREPPPLFLLSVGEAFSVIHLRDDMLSVLRQSHQAT